MSTKNEYGILADASKAEFALVSGEVCWRLKAAR